MSRFAYVRYDQASQEIQDVAKSAVEKLEGIITILGPGRAQSLAMTKLEEVYMWIGKAVRDDQIKRNGSAPAQEARKDG